jgi:ribokinase/sulfofructose kinase
MQFPFKLDEKKEFDVVGFGTNAVDFLIQVPEYPAFNSKIELDNYIQAAGGEIATTVAGLSRLGMKTAYVGRFGDDKAGDFGLQSLRNEGVDLRFTAQIVGANTQIAFILIDIRNGERTVIWKRDAKLAYTEQDAPTEVAKLGKILHFTPHDALACAKMARAAKDSGAIISIDIDNVFEGINEVLPLVDILIASAEFPEKIAGIKDQKDALLEIKSRFGCPIVGMTLGETGSLLLCENEFIRTKGFAVPGGCKDTTGAGDSFRVGLLYGVLQGASVEESARMANAVAALKCRAVGARTSLPDEKELFDLLS